MQQHLRFGFTAVGIALAAFVVAPVAVAQQKDTPEQQEPSEARRHFERGIELADDNRWVEALDAFRASLELEERVSTRFNVANALFRMGRPVEAREELQRYLEHPDVEADEARREQGEQLMRKVDEAVATLDLAVDPASAIVEIDGEPTEGEGSRRQLVLDPGNHRLSVRADGHETHRERIEVELGEEASLDITLDEDANDSLERSLVEPDVAQRPEGRDDRTLVGDPVFWAIAGAAVVGVATAVGVGVALAGDGGGGEPYGGGTGVVFEALTSP